MTGSRNPAADRRKRRNHQSDYVAVPADGCAWITGASSGIGRELALDLARDGWSVAVTARSAEKLTSLEQAADELPGEIHAYPGDVSDTRLMQCHAGVIAGRHGGISLLIANAGVYLPLDGLTCDPEVFRKSYEVNVMGTVNVVAPVVSQMSVKGRGQIAIMASVAGYGGLPLAAAYGPTKAALINMAESLKFDLDRAGVRIQVINPGFVDTPATEDNSFPMPYLITPEKAVAAIRRGLADRKRFEIAFPRPFVRQLKLLGLLPYRLYFALVARSTGWQR